MSPPSGTRDEYSRKDGASRRARGAVAVPSRGAYLAHSITRRKPRVKRRFVLSRGLRVALLVGGLAGALALVVAEFTTLYSVHVVGRSAPVQTVTGGSNNSYAMIPIALVALVLVLAAIRSSSRWALAALGLVGLVALLIGLVGDLPGAHRTGTLRFAGHYVRGASSPSVGMYLETLGAVILIATAGVGLLLAEVRTEAVPPDEGAGEGEAS